MVSLLARTLLLLGSLILASALGSVRRLMGRLPQGAVRRHWYTLTALIALFLVGYLAYAAVTWNRLAAPSDLLVPGIFFFGACFVALTASLALRTAIDVRRTTLLELETVTDPLTGVHNRRYLDRRLREDLTCARRYKNPLALVFLDIDHFKHINDQHGHAAGDRVLKDLASLLASELRETDVLTRYGGEEFVILTPHTTVAGATEIAERLLRRIEAHSFELDPGWPPLRVTCSAGVAGLGEGLDASEGLLQAADTCLYRAKQEGRNRVVALAAGPPAVAGAS